MSEELLKAIIQLFSIIVKERLTEDERDNIREFLAFHLNQESISYYEGLFQQYHEEYRPEIGEIEDADQETIEFVDDWARIVEIGKRINAGLTRQQKLVLILKIIELILADRDISERQSNLIFYIGEIIKVGHRDVQLIEDFVRGQDTDELNSKNMLIIDDGSGEHPYKSKRLSANELTGLVAIVKIPDSEIYFIKYLGISDISLNGVPMKSRRISIFPTGSTIRGSKFSPIYYSDVVGSYLREDATTEISFVAENISYKFKSGDIGLKDIYIAEEGGNLVGVMGASGSGKSTLMSVLNGSESPTSGRVLINGVDIHKQKNKVEGVIGFVPQDDLLVEELTVYENLYFAAKLCFGNLSEQEIHSLVLNKLKILGLAETKDLKVGSPLDKTISGGQRKRVNIGLELLREPAVLFVDEPTSGLSSRDSENIMDLLKELSLRGKMIFVVIHQPSSDIYKMFDSMIILDVGGYQIYYGNPLEAVVYFKTQVNMVNKDQSACMECGNVNAEQIFTIIENKVVNEFGRFTDQRKITPKQWRLFYQKTNGKPSPPTPAKEIESTLSIPHKRNQWRIFLNRDLLSKIGNKQYMLFALLEAPVLAFFLSYLIRYYTVFDDGLTKYIFNSNSNIVTYFFMSIIVAIFMGLTISAEEILRDRKILKRESFLNLSRGSYLYAKIAVLFGISAIQTLTFVLLGNYILEVKDMNMALWMILFSSGCFANLTGLNISSAFNSAVTIYILIPLLIIPQLVLSGIVIDFDKFNNKIASTDHIPWFGELMASRWAFEATMVDQFKNNRYERIFYDIEKKEKNAHYFKTYYIPKLETSVSLAFNSLSNTDSSKDDRILRENLLMLRNELGKQDKLVGGGKYNYLDKLTVKDFNKEIYDTTIHFIKSLENYYTSLHNRYNGERGDLLSKFNATPEATAVFNRTRNLYANEKIKMVVTNEQNPLRIVKSKGRLIQKIYPIYSDPDPRHPLDFKANFYSPKKHFMGVYFDTLWFNIGFIWFMSIFLVVALYFEWLRKLVTFFEKVVSGKKFIRGS
jgi:ABC-type multidrug transport system ATPase subunit